MAKTIIWIAEDNLPRNVRNLTDTHLENLISYLSRRGFPRVADIVAIEKLRREMQGRNEMCSNISETIYNIHMKKVPIGVNKDTHRLVVIETDNQIEYNSWPNGFVGLKGRHEAKIMY